MQYIVTDELNFHELIAFIAESKMCNKFTKVTRVSPCPRQSQDALPRYSVNQTVCGHAQHACCRRRTLLFFGVSCTINCRINWWVVIDCSIYHTYWSVTIYCRIYWAVAIGCRIYWSGAICCRIYCICWTLTIDCRSYCIHRSVVIDCRICWSYWSVTIEDKASSMNTMDSATNCQCSIHSAINCHCQ